MITTIKMQKDVFDMYSNYIPNAETNNLERRKDARRKISEVQQVVANCKTMDSHFQAPIENVSSGGVFINTTQHLFAGQEIAMKFDFPDARNTIMANGEIVRTSLQGAGIRFRMFFRK